MKIVKVVAVDWSFYSDMYRLPATFAPVDSILVGFLIEDKPEYIAIAYEDHTEEDNSQVRRITSIPRCCVKSIVELKEVKGASLV